MFCSSIPLFHGEHHSITARKDVDMTFASQNLRNKLLLYWILESQTQDWQIRTSISCFHFRGDSSMQNWTQIAEWVIFIDLYNRYIYISHNFLNKRHKCIIFNKHGLRAKSQLEQQHKIFQLSNQWFWNIGGTLTQHLIGRPMSHMGCPIPRKLLPDHWFLFKSFQGEADVKSLDVWTMRFQIPSGMPYCTCFSFNYQAKSFKKTATIMKVILPKTKSSHLKIGRDPKGWPGISTTHFSGKYLSFREGSLHEKNNIYLLNPCESNPKRSHEKKHALLSVILLVA